LQISVRKHIFECLGSGRSLFRLLCGGLSWRSCCCLGILLVLWCICGRRSFRLPTIRRGPEGQIVAQQLHDQSAVTVGFLGKRVKLGDSVVKGLLGKVTSSVRRVQDFVVEDREVQRETETNRVCWSELSLCNVGGILIEVISPSKVLTNKAGSDNYLVCFVSSGSGNLTLFAGGKLS
jgi:hypothetical protein